MNISTERDSDTSDEDYVPNTKPTENLSEDYSGEESDGDISSNKQNILRTKKRTKSSLVCRKKQKKADYDHYVSENTESEPLTAENKQKMEDDVWADFIKDTGFQTREKGFKSYDQSNTKSLKSIDDGKLERNKRILVTEIVNFAGEDITVETTLTQGTSENKVLNEVPTSTNSKNTSKNTHRGVGGILSQLTRKPKINTLEKSKLDWDKFKREERLEEELQTYNKGKDGYLEKQDFLRRADLRRFEIEKGIRTLERSKRSNDSL